MTCRKCQGRAVQEFDELGAHWRCLNCGKRDYDMRAPKTNVEKAEALVKKVDGHLRTRSITKIDEEEHELDPTIDAPSMETRVQCAAEVAGGGHCKTVRVLGKLYCQRHLDKFDEMTAQKQGTTALPDPRCSVAGCQKPKCAESVQCERHYRKSLRNNARYRARAREAMNGDGPGSWKDEVLSRLLEQRDLLAKKMAGIDQTIVTVQGL